MRRQDREITDRAELIRVMRSCDVCRLALNDESGYPYILPLNFGLIDDGETVELYFHGATTGTKYELIAKDNRASFEMDWKHELQYEADKCRCTMTYESVIGRGYITILPDEEKVKALDAIMNQYHPDGTPYNPAAIARTTVMKLTVTQMTGKAKTH